MANSTFNNLFSYVDGLIVNYVYDSSTSVIEWFAPIFSSLMILWVVIYGYMLMYGQIQAPAKTFIFKIIQIGFIFTLGLTASFYNGIVVDFLMFAPNQLSSVISGATNSTSASSLDSLFQKVFDLSDKAWEQGGLLDGNIGMYFISIAILFFGGILTLITASLILLSKLLLAALLAVGPVFIALVLFNSTQRFFESWLNQIVNTGLILVLATAIGGLVVSLADFYISQQTNPDLGNAATMGLVFGFAIIVMNQVQSVASSLGGGIAMATQGAVSNAINKYRPSNIRRGARNLQRDWTATKRGANVAASPAKGAYKVAQSGRATYQKRFGKGNSVSGV